MNRLHFVLRIQSYAAHRRLDLENQSLSYTPEKRTGIRLTHAVGTLGETSPPGCSLAEYFQLITSRSLWESDSVGPEGGVCNVCYIANLTPGATKRNDKDRLVSTKVNVMVIPCCRAASVSRVSKLRL